MTKVGNMTEQYAALTVFDAPRCAGVLPRYAYRVRPLQEFCLVDDRVAQCLDT